MEEKQIDNSDEKSMFLKDFDEVEQSSLDEGDFFAQENEDKFEEETKSTEEQKDLTEEAEIKSADEKTIDEKTDLNDNSDAENEELQPQFDVLRPKEQLREEMQDEGQDLENSPLKKYIVQISSEFVPLIDSMTVDERIAYINDAIALKIDIQKEQEVEEAKKQFAIHGFIFVIVTILVLPFAILIVNKAIMMTFENYKYSQDNFEKLYKQRFEQDSAYMRSIQYNRKHSVK